MPFRMASGCCEGLLKRVYMSEIILGIESSCDDTSAAVIKNGELLSNVTASQAVHESYGGVVPELASRAHELNIVPVVDQAIKKAGITKEDISAVAFTRGPGLMGSLLVGVSFAKGFARSLGVPMVDVNHLQGHVLAHFIQEPEVKKETPKYPFLCLLVSGGNSQIVLVKAYNDMEVIGQTIDDAAGEAIDVEFVGLNENQQYSVAMGDYMYANYKGIEAENVATEGILLTDILLNDLRANSPIDYSNEPVQKIEKR